MPYVGFGAREAEQAEESTSLIERHVEEGVLKPSNTTKTYHEQPFFIRCIKSVARLGSFVCGRVCAILTR